MTSKVSQTVPSSKITISSKKPTTSKTTNKTISFDNAIQEYYKLKGSYEKILRKTKDKIIRDDSLTLSEKKEKFNLIKPKCIVCNQIGGTIFEKNGNILSAKCGNPDKSCKLDIKLQTGFYANINFKLNNNYNNLVKLKEDIIKTKLNYLFLLETEEKTLENFKKLKSDLVDLAKLYEKTTNYYIDLLDNSKNIKDIQKLTTIIDLEIKKFKELIVNYEISETDQLIKEAVELFINRISIISNDIQKLLYRQQYVYYNEKDNTYNLIQNKYNFDELITIDPNTENKIISFQI